MKGFILCAGLGKRLRPITEEIPKPLLPVLGKPLVESIIEKLKEAGILEIGINLHWKPELLKRFFKKFEREFDFHFFYEKNLLDTGGALKNAKKFLKSTSFIVINSDIIFDFPLKDLIDFHKKNKNFGTLLITDNSKSNNLKISKEGKLLSISKKFSKNLKTFAGIAVYEPEILNFMEKEIFSIKETWLEAIKKGLNLNTFYIEPEKWKECGSIESYVKNLIFFLKKNGEKNFISQEANIENLNLEGFNIIERGAVLKNIKLKNSIVLPEVHLKENKSFKILGKNFELKILRNYFKEIILSKDKFLREFTQKNYIFLKPIYGSGSTRNFYSFQKKYIFLKSSKEDKEFERLIKLNKLFSKHKIPVPEILKYSSRDKLLIMKNCGNYSLYDFSKFLSKEDLKRIYEKILEKIAILHKIKLKNKEIFKNHQFSREYFLWESNYFYENFLKNYLKIKKNYNFFKDDFEKLAKISSSFEWRVIHRDLQSQNILVNKSQITFIDFQSSRLGPPSYDISSLLWDPYLIIPDGLRVDLLNFYRKEMGEFLPKDFEESLRFVRCQRHFQALGAYGFLGIVKGKKNFLKYIKPCLYYLKKELGELDGFHSFYFLKEKVFNKTCF